MLCTLYLSEKCTYNVHMINISTFRNHLKKFFDEADSQVVEIERDGKIYYLSSKPVINENRIEKLLLKILDKVESRENSKTKVYYENIPQPLPKPSYAENIFKKKAESVTKGLPCCKKQKPCQHWQYNPEGFWINTLTGDKREVNE